MRWKISYFCVYMYKYKRRGYVFKLAVLVYCYEAVSNLYQIQAVRYIASIGNFQEGNNVAYSKCFIMTHAILVLYKLLPKIMEYILGGVYWKGSKLGTITGMS